jgi:transposase
VKRLRGMSTDAALALPEDPALLKAVAAQQQATIEAQQRELEQLKHYVAQLLRQRYGPRSEKLDPAQLALFELQTPNVAASSQADQPTAAETAVKAHVRRGGGRNEFPADLPRKRVEYPLPPEQLACPCCGQDRTKFGEEVSEQLEFVPASLLVIEHVRFKYACRHCQEQVAVAEKPPQPIEKGIPGPGLLAATITGKYCDHLPLYRLEDVFARHGAELSRATMCGWMRQSAELVLPLYELLKRRVLASRVIHTDDTPVEVLDPSLPHTRTGRFWVYVGDVCNPYVVYDYTPSRKRDGPAEFLKDYQGYLQADAFAGYDGIYSGSGGKIIEVGCWAHARRKFFEAKETAARAAHEALARIGQLYALERELAEWCAGDGNQLTVHERAARIAAARQEHALPKLTALRIWLDKLREDTLPKSPIGTAARYALHNWESLRRYCDDGELAIDNNLAERAVKPCAIGRKNWLFCGNDNGGRTAAVLFSLTSSAKRHGLDPFAWLRDVLTRLPVLRAASDPIPDDLLQPLLPDVWAAFA